MSRERDNGLLGTLINLRKVHSAAAEDAPDPDTAGRHGASMTEIAAVIALVIVLSAGASGALN